MLSWNQKYSIASSLAVNSTNAVKEKLKDNWNGGELKDGLEFLELIQKFYTKRSGYVPQQVIKIINSPTK